MQHGCKRRDWLQESQNHRIVKAGKYLNEHQVQNEGPKETSKLMTLSHCNTDLALASNQSCLSGDFKASGLYLWFSEGSCSGQQSLCKAAPCAEQKRELRYCWSVTPRPDTQREPDLATTSWGEEQFSSSATLQTRFVCGELCRHCQLEKEIR